MRTPRALLKSVAKALLNAAGGGIIPIGDLAFDVVPALSKDVMAYWRDATPPEQRRAEVQALAQADDADVRQTVADIVREVASHQAPQLQQTMAQYLAQIPAAVRRSLRRPADPSGKTVPAGLVLEQPKDLLPLLPVRLPRFKPGDRPNGVGDWELVELLGIGGFGEVWKARHLRVKDRPCVALKFCLDDRAAELLRREAAVLSLVMEQGQHPGIVRLQNTALATSPPCLEYEYIAGGDLNGFLHDEAAAGQGLAPSRAAQVILALADIIGHTHRLPQPIVHRDLKPANILVQRDAKGHIQFKIADFGIGGLAAQHALNEQTRLGGRAGRCATTLVRGAYSPLYSSPQQMNAEAPDARDDVYSLGVVWYQLLAGDLSLGAPSGLMWFEKLRQRHMSADQIQLLASCFEARQEDRPADGRALAERLQATLKAKPPVMESPKHPRPKVKKSSPSLAPNGF